MSDERLFQGAEEKNHVDFQVLITFPELFFNWEQCAGVGTHQELSVAVIFCLQSQVSESQDISVDNVLMSMMLILTGLCLLFLISNVLPSSLTGFNLLFGSICPPFFGRFLCCLFQAVLFLWSKCPGSCRQMCGNIHDLLTKMLLTFANFIFLPFLHSFHIQTFPFRSQSFHLSLPSFLVQREQEHSKS